MTSEKQTDGTSLNSGESNSPGGSSKRLILYITAFLVVFLLGLVPMWMTARDRQRERDEAQAALRISSLQNSLASAAIDARRGEYEPARQSASTFFTSLGTEIERGSGSVFNVVQQNNLRSMFASRDDTITLLARSDPAAADRLVDLYNTYRQATGGTPAR